MDIKKLRKPSFTPLESSTARASTLERAPRPVAVVGAKTMVAPPAEKGGALWQSFYAAALLRNDPDPEKMADSMLRARERALAIAGARHKTILTLSPPNTAAAAAANPTKSKPVLHDAFRCKALTLEGRRCGFKSTCGDFCKKHSVEKI